MAVGMDSHDTIAVVPLVVMEPNQVKAMLPERGFLAFIGMNFNPGDEETLADMLVAGHVPMVWAWEGGFHYNVLRTAQNQAKRKIGTAPSP
jgi:predicted metal-dependent enzyme (double-stranded beta helix superfamily)